MVDSALANRFAQHVQSSEAALRRVPISVWRTAIVVIAVIWLVHSAARLIWLLLPEPNLPQPPVVAQTVESEVATAVSYSVDLAALQEIQLFGVASAEIEVPTEPTEPEVSENVRTTNLNLDLVGVMASSSESESFAAIAQGSNQELYQIGDVLPGGNNVKLSKIFSDRVIINNGGEFEALWLYSDEDFVGGRPTTYNNASRPTVSRSQREDDGEQEAQAVTRSIAASEVESISDVVRFSVHREGGQMVGFRIRPGRDAELFNRLGLQANDVVTTVNGIPIDSAQAIRDNYQQLKSATTADLEIKRGEERVFVTISLDQ